MTTRSVDGAHAARRSTLLTVIAAAVAVSTALACGSDASTSPSRPPPSSSLLDRALAAGLAPLPSAPVRPADNPLLPERVELGHVLFFDPILSGPRDVACSTCHLPSLAFTDGRQFPSGAGASGLGVARTDPGPPPLRLMPRNSPTVFNVGLFGRMSPVPSVNATMFWGASAFGLEDQVLNPIAADNELRGLTYDKVIAFDSVLERLRGIEEYRTRFAAAFPDVASGGVTAPDRILTVLTLRRALAAYLRELVTPRAPIDRFLAGDTLALDADERAGLALFIGKAGCVSCHTGPLLSDFKPHVLGVRQMGLGRDTTPGDDLGWGEHGGTPYAFRTPPLRFVTRTPPYFHDGAAATLLDVVRFKSAAHSEAPRVPQSSVDRAAIPFTLTDAEVAQLIRFLGALDDTITTQQPLFRAPERVPSGLPIPR